MTGISIPCSSKYINMYLSLGTMAVNSSPDVMHEENSKNEQCPKEN
jgi:hypothetical protein